MKSLLLLTLFVILSACASLEAATTSEATRALTAAPTATPTWSPLDVTPVVTPYTPAPPACADAPETRLILHERGVVSDEDTRALRVREQPGTEGTKILDLLEVYEMFYVLEGPRCADGFAWFRVRGAKVEGWIAEGDFEVYYVEPYLPG